MPKPTTTVRDGDAIRVDRLCSKIPDPFKILGVNRDADFDKMPPHVQYIEDDGLCRRTDAYSLGRIRYFRDQFRAGNEVTPLILDNAWGPYSPYALLLNDGHHRLCGAILAGSDHVVVDYSGDVKALKWLKGERDKPPDWLED